MTSQWALAIILGLLLGWTSGYRFRWNFDEGTLGVVTKSHKLPLPSFLATQDVHFLDYDKVYKYGSVAGPNQRGRFLNSDEWTIGFWKRVGTDRTDDAAVRRTLFQFPDGAELQTRFGRYDIVYNGDNVWDTYLSADLRITRDTSFGGLERVTFVCKRGKLSLYINAILIYEDVAVSTMRLRESPMFPATFKGTIWIGKPQDFYDLNITGIILLRKALTKKQVSETVYFNVPPGTKLYLPTISTQGAAPLSDYIPGREFDGTALFSRIPQVGEFPRLLFSYQDLQNLKRRMSASKKGNYSLESVYAEIGDWLKAEGDWFLELERGLPGAVPNDEQLSRLSDLATSALLASDRNSSFAQRVANATYWTIVRIKAESGSQITREYNMERVGRSYAVFLAFDMVARFMPEDRVNSLMAFFVLLGKNAWYYEESQVEPFSNQQDIGDSLKTKILWRGSNRDIWTATTLCMNQILIHGWRGSDPADVEQWNPYFQRVLRSLHTQNGNGVEPYGKEATWRAQLVVLALKRLLPTTPNFLAHPQLYRWYESKVLTLLPFSGNVDDLGTYQRALYRPSTMSSLFPDNPIFAFGSRLRDIQHPGYLPASARKFAIRNREAYGFLKNKVTQSDVHLAFTTNPDRPTPVVDGQRPGSFRTNTSWSSDGAETTDAVFQGGKPFVLTIELIDENSPTLSYLQQDLFALVSKNDEPFFVLTVVEETKWGFVIGSEVVASIRRVVNKWVKVEVRFSGSALKFLVDGVMVGSSQSALPQLGRLFLVIGYRLHRTDKGRQNRCIRASYGRIQASEGGRTVLDVGDFSIRDIDYMLHEPVTIDDLYDLVDSTTLIAPLKRGENALDLSPLHDALPALPLVWSDSDMGRFSARASFGPDTTGVVFFCGQGLHQKKSGGHVDIVGAGMAWIMSPRRLMGKNAEEYMTILVDGQLAPGLEQSERGYFIGARQSNLSSGAAVDLTLYFRNRDIVFVGRDDGFSSNEFPVTSESINATYAYRSVALLSGRGSRAVILVVDDMRMMDGKPHKFTHISPSSDTDWITSRRQLSGKYGDYEYVIATNRTVWRDRHPDISFGPLSWHFENSNRKSCLVRILRGSRNRKPVRFETRELYGYKDLYQDGPPEIFYRSTGDYSRHIGNQIRASVEDRTADFVTAYYPHEEGERIPIMYWLNGTALRVEIDPTLSHTLNLRSSPYTDRTVVSVESVEIVGGKERRSSWSLDP